MSFNFLVSFIVENFLIQSLRSGTGHLIQNINQFKMIKNTGLMLLSCVLRLDHKNTVFNLAIVADNTIVCKVQYTLLNANH